MSLLYWLPVLIDSLDEVNEFLLHRRPPLVLNGKDVLILRARLQAQEFLKHLERLQVLPQLKEQKE